jgi:hypothetical protein
MQDVLNAIKKYIPMGYQLSTSLICRHFKPADSLDSLNTLNTNPASVFHSWSQVEWASNLGLDLTKPLPFLVASDPQLAVSLKPSPETASKMLRDICRRGELDTLRYLLDTSEYFRKIAIKDDMIRSDGNVWVNLGIEFYSTRFEYMTLFTEAALYGHLDILEWLYQTKSARESLGFMETRALICAAIRSHDIIPATRRSKSSLPVVKWLLSIGGTLCDDATLSAAKHGDVELLKWMSSLNEECEWHAQTAECAALAPNAIEVLKFLRTNDHVPVDARVYTSAPIHVMQWARRPVLEDGSTCSPYPWCPSIIRNAVMGKNKLERIKWLRHPVLCDGSTDVPCPWGDESDIDMLLDALVDWGDMEVFAWILSEPDFPEFDPHILFKRLMVAYEPTNCGSDYADLRLDMLLWLRQPERRDRFRWDERLTAMCCTYDVLDVYQVSGTPFMLSWLRDSQRELDSGGRCPWDESAYLAALDDVDTTFVLEWLSDPRRKQDAGGISCSKEVGDLVMRRLLHTYYTSKKNGPIRRPASEHLSKPSA